MQLGESSTLWDLLSLCNIGWQQVLSLQKLTMSQFARFNLLKGVLCRTYCYSSQVCRNVSVSSCRSKESSLTSTPGNQDILLKSIKSSKETADVLHYIDKHHSIMNQHHVLQAFKTVFSLQKSEPAGMSNGEVTRSSQFRTLCNLLKSRVRALDLNETVDVLKSLSFLGVPASSKLVSILLNMLASRVNELSLHQIVFLDFMVKDFKSTPIVDALKIALPVVFQANLAVKADKDNVSQACYLLHYASKKKLGAECVDSLIDIIMRKRHQLDLGGAMSVVRSVCDFPDTDESHRPLLHHCLDLVLDNMSSCSFGELDVLLSKLASKYSKENYFFYREEFIGSVCRSVVDNDCGFEEAVWTLRKLNRFGHADSALLDYIAMKALGDPVLCSRPSVLFTVVRGFATADYRPFNWDLLEPAIARYTMEAFNQDADIPWFSFVRDLCVIGVWPMSIILRMFQEDFLKVYLSKYSSVLDQLQVLCLHQEISTLCPEQNDIRPPQSVLQKAVDINGKNVSEFPLLAPLQQGLGGSAFVATGVYTRLGHFLHHVIVLRQGGYPMPLTAPPPDQRVCVEDLRVSEEHRVISVMCLPASFYTSNTERLKGPIRIQLDSMKALGLLMVPINSARWEALLEHEKIPYLMREINQVCDNSESAQANS